MSRYIFLLDNGHGENTAGKRSPKLEDGRQLLEYEFVRKIVKAMEHLLKEHNISYRIITPELKDISLGERVRRANETKQKALFMSIHANAAGDGINWHEANGIETFYAKGSDKGKKMARIFQDNMLDICELKDRGVKEGDFYVIKKTNMPAILTECGFYTNKEEVKKLLDEEYVDRFATAHMAAILDIEKHGL